MNGKDVVLPLQKMIANAAWFNWAREGFTIEDLGIHKAGGTRTPLNT